MAQVAPLIRVFFSSTFADFQDERDTLQSRVFPAVRRYCLERGARFLPIDLRWGIATEASTEQYVVRACLDEVAKCQRASPFFNFVALIGDRYGSQLVPEEIPSADFLALLQALSARDRDLAARWYRLDENGLPPVYVLRSRDGSWDKEGDQLRKALSDACARVAIDPKTRLAILTSVTDQEVQAGIFAAGPLARPLALRRRLRGLTIPKTFREEAAAGRSKLASLERRLRGALGSNMGVYDARLSGDKIAQASLDAFAEQMEQELIKRVDYALQREASQAVSLRHWSFAQDRLSHFMGQEDARERIGSYLSAAARTPFAVTGQSGVGKTALLLKAAETAQITYPNAHHLWYFIGGSTAVATVAGLIEDIERQMLAQYPQDNKLQVPDSASEREGRLPEFLGIATAEHPAVIIIDALDQLQAGDVTKWIPRALPPHTHLMVSVLPGTDAEYLRTRLPHEAWLEVKPLPDQLGGQLLDAWLADSRRTLTARQREAVMRHYAQHRNPLGLRVIAEMARRWSSWEDAPALPPTTQGLIQDLLDRLEQPARHGRPLVENSLGLIASGKQGLTEDEVLAVISDDAELVRGITHTHPHVPDTTVLPAVLWARVYADLEWALTEREVDRSQALTFYHRQVSDAIHERYLNPGTLRTWHRRLAHFFNRRPDNVPYLINTAAQPRAVVNERMVDELVYQQVQGGLYGDAKRTIFDAEYLQARIQMNGTSQALADIDADLRRDGDVQLLMSVLVLSQPILDTLPQELPNQIWGRSHTLYRMMRNWAGWDDPHLRLESYTLGKPLTQGELELSHQKSVVTCAFNRDGTKVVSGSRDKTVRVWDLSDLDTHADDMRSVMLQAHEAEVRACAFDPSGAYIVSGSDDTTVKLWSSDGGLLHSFEDHTGQVLWCAFDPTGQRIASASADKTARVYDLSTREQIRHLVGHEQALTRCVFSPDSTRLATASRDGTVRVWHLASGATQILRGHHGEVTTCLFTPDGMTVVSASADRTVRVWDLNSGDGNGAVQAKYVLIEDDEAGRTGKVYDIALCPTKSHLLVSAAEDGRFRLWDIRDGVFLRSVSGQSNGIRSCAFTPDGQTIVGASWGNEFLVWDWMTDKPIQNLSGHVFGLNACAVSPDGSLAVSASEDKTVHVWDVADAANRRLKAVLGMPSDVIRACAVSADGTLSVRGTASGWLELEETRTQFGVHRWQGHPICVRGCAFTPDDQHIVSVSEDHLLRLWTTGTRDCTDYVGARSHLRCCAVSPDGKELLGGGGWHADDNTIRLWQVGEPCSPRDFTDHKQLVVDCCFSLDGARFYSVSYDNSIWIWDKASGVHGAIFQGPESPTGQLRTIGLSHDGSRLAYGGTSGAITICDALTGEVLWAFPAHTHYVNTCRFTADDRYLVSCSSDSTVKIWDLTSSPSENPKPLATWRGNNETLVCMAFDAYQGRLFVAEDDAFHTLSLVNLPSNAPSPGANRAGQQTNREDVIIRR